MDLTSILQLGAQPAAKAIHGITDKTEKAIAIGFISGAAQFFSLLEQDLAVLESATPTA